ncbi:MAG: glycerophosphodiester phosphodiesterase family protein [Clostridia bacterium]|nr:glycerophosphodiester phosphodiesterase family protein [Clostridia bacterium]
MKAFKKYLSVMFAIVMLFSTLSLNVFAEEKSTSKMSAIDEIIFSFNNPNGRLMCVANKGNWRSFPENSLEGIQSCIDMGVDIVSVDIQRTKDGKFVLMSSDDLSRMCVLEDGRTATAKVSEETLEDIKEFYFLRDSRGGANAKSTKYKVPSLEEAISLCKENSMLMINNAWEYGDEVQSIVKSLEADEIVILRGATTAEDISAYIDRNGLPISHICGYYEGVVSSPAKKYVKDTMASGAKIIQLSSPNSYSSLFKMSVLKKFKDNGRAFVSTTSPELCGGREDLRSDWSDLAGRGFSVIETNYPQDLIKYISEIESYRSSLSALITQAQGINNSNYSKDSSKELKSALKDAEELSAIGSTSLEKIDVARYNLQQAIDSMTPRVENESDGIGTGTIVFIIIIALALLVLIAFVLLKSKKKSPPTPPNGTDEISKPTKKRQLKRHKHQKPNPKSNKSEPPIHPQKPQD